ncbi:protein L [Pseudomonas typographi]|uniref:Protein L n=1 Tax=Pseudomonas typographi TaxID=2715964 RepID=A0ABR7Z9W6_9PSED|nr:protein L [Pseudomonas typographi]MBD1554719.1 protein L [Pseudomonas typographi]MBD1590168.1 protein L [Pseudomonas typographi]MBD1602262.1 protein L [Pseudomonas typographi]
MAQFIRSTTKYLTEITPTILGSGPEWTSVFTPGQRVPTSGIYRCKGCSQEISANEGNPFPPQNHHQHALLEVGIEWQLIVKTNAN